MRKTKKSFRNVPTVKGSYLARGKKIGIVVSEFNEFLTHRLLDGALDTLLRHGAKEKDIQVVTVPGAFEMPLVVQKLVAKKKFDAILTLAVVIKGETKHFDQVVTETARGIREISQRSQIPVILGMIPARSVSQAIARIGIKQMNKGREWAMSAIAMANLMKRLER